MARGRPRKGDNREEILTDICSMGLLLGGLACLASAADQTWTGQVSDSMCGASHAKMIAGHPGMSERDCALACVKGGGKYVFVSDGKVYNIANQGLGCSKPTLVTLCGSPVK